MNKKKNKMKAGDVFLSHDETRTYMVLDNINTKDKKKSKWLYKVFDFKTMNVIRFSYNVDCYTSIYEFMKYEEQKK